MALSGLRKRAGIHISSAIPLLRTAAMPGCSLPNALSRKPLGPRASTATPFHTWENGLGNDVAQLRLPGFHPTGHHRSLYPFLLQAMGRERTV